MCTNNVQIRLDLDLVFVGLATITAVLIRFGERAGDGMGPGPHGVSPCMVLQLCHGPAMVIRKFSIKKYKCGYTSESVGHRPKCHGCLGNFSALFSDLALSIWPRRPTPPFVTRIFDSISSKCCIKYGTYVPDDIRDISDQNVPKTLTQRLHHIFSNLM
jgi:hypothetical protein